METIIKAYKAEYDQLIIDSVKILANPDIDYKPDLLRIVQLLSVMDRLGRGRVKTWRCDLREPELKLVG